MCRASDKVECVAKSGQQLGAADLIYIPRARGFVYFVAVIDWYTRKVLA